MYCFHEKLCTQTEVRDSTSWWFCRAEEGWPYLCLLLSKWVGNLLWNFYKVASRNRLDSLTYTKQSSSEPISKWDVESSRRVGVGVARFSYIYKCVWVPLSPSVNRIQELVPILIMISRMSELWRVWKFVSIITDIFYTFNSHSAKSSMHRFVSKLNSYLLIHKNFTKTKKT